MEVIRKHSSNLLIKISNNNEYIAIITDDIYMENDYDDLSIVKFINIYDLLNKDGFIKYISFIADRFSNKTLYCQIVFDKIYSKRLSFNNYLSNFTTAADTKTDISKMLTVIADNILELKNIYNYFQNLELTIPEFLNYRNYIASYHALKIIASKLDIDKFNKINTINTLNSDSDIICSKLDKLKISMDDKKVYTYNCTRHSFKSFINVYTINKYGLLNNNRLNGGISFVHSPINKNNKLIVDIIVACNLTQEFIIFLDQILLEYS